MKIKNITLGLLLCITASYAQNKYTTKADQLFDSYQYVDAIEEYLNLANSKKADHYVYTQLAESYYNVFDTANASKWYAKAIEEKANAETYFRYAQTLKSLGKYQEANTQMDVFAKMMPNDARAKEHKANPNYIPSLANSKAYDVAITNIPNDGQSDFGAQLTNDNVLYFTSTRNASTRTDKWSNQPYLDIFKAERNDKGLFAEPVAVKELNTAFHDGPLTISADGNTIFFARDGHSEGQFKKTKDNNYKVGQQGLYKATKVDGKWSQIEALPFNSTEYSVTNPSLSKDGKTLYFASNMPGGFGESDLWKVAVEPNGYGAPQNLGATINTAEKENFPFISEENVLYFASTGHQGAGGFDIYKIEMSAAGIVENLGKPINTEKDDFSFSFNTTLHVGYFSSNRNGSDAIYSATPVCAAQAVIVVTNSKTGKPLSNATVSIIDFKGYVIANQQTDALGKVSYEIGCKMGYNIEVTAPDYEKGTFSVMAVPSGISTVDAPLTPVSVIITDTEVILNSIYFEFDKSNITAQGASELDKLVKVMKDYPTMAIFVKSHTDSKGKASYNLNLSERRAQSTVQYLISRGIAKNRLSGKGFGNLEPKINCGTDCTEEQHAQNRRSEFLIVKK